MRGELGEFQHRPVARRDGGDEGAEAQHHRKVPRHDNADHPERLEVHLYFGGGQQQAGVTAVGLHPALEPLLGVVDLHDAGQHIGDQAVVVAALTIICRQRLAQLPLVGEQCLFEFGQLRPALGQGWHGVSQTRPLEPRQLIRQGQFDGEDILRSVLKLRRTHVVLRMKNDRLISRSKSSCLLPECKAGKLSAVHHEPDARENCVSPHTFVVCSLVTYLIRGSFWLLTYTERAL